MIFTGTLLNTDYQSCLSWFSTDATKLFWIICFKGYRSSQFRGVIKNFRIRGERIPLRGRATYGLVEVWHCSAPEVQKFVDSIQNPPQLARGRIQSSIGRRRGGGHIRPKKPGEEEEGLEEEESLGEGEMEEENEEADDTGMGEKGDTMGESEPDTPVL